MPGNLSVATHTEESVSSSQAALTVNNPSGSGGPGGASLFLGEMCRLLHECSDCVMSRRCCLVAASPLSGSYILSGTASSAMFLNLVVGG